MLRIILIALCALAFDGPLEFEVASVRPIPPPMAAYNTSFQITPRGFDANFAALRQIAGVAYNIQRYASKAGRRGWIPICTRLPPKRRSRI